MKRRIGLGILLAATMLSACSGGENPAVPQGSSGPARQSLAAENTSASGQGGEAYTIALIAPFTGDNAQYGNAFKTGVTALCDEVNAAGGINGAELTFEVFDDGADAEQSTNMAQIVT